ncbi:hypothetical protein SAMN05444281_2319 [Wenyingzhuangia marina]|uniref:O-Antigen ligase n=2 Tax=Wenyingzhuangia marina TaxID=1195760 RepID=A0A1M5WD43_9FLAO|nr:hypothetical protein GCM10011397_25970 [Wenyingzhuangia marina]SHH85338.1 hypothetical protein SAMN05444281_2319 [Wenyingzhuangia marina]
MLNIFSFILIFIVGYILSKKNSLKSKFKDFFILEIIFSVFRINVGYFLKIGDFEIQNDDLLLAILFAMSIVVFGSSISKKIKIRQYVVIYTIIIILGMLNLYLNPSDEGIIAFNTGSWDRYMRGVTNLTTPVFSMQSILMFIRVVIFVAIMLATKDLFNREDFIEMGKRIGFFSKLLLIYGITEFLLSYVLKIDTTNILKLFFGRGVATSNDFGRLKGLSREPSYYSHALYNAIIILYALSKIDYENKNIFKKYKVWIIIAFFLGLISSSFAFVLVTVTLLIFFYVVSNIENRKFVFYLKPQAGLISILGLLILMIILPFVDLTDFTYYERILESLNQFSKGVNRTYKLGSDYSSEAVRLISGIETFKATLSRPLFGLGIGTAYSVSGIISILSNIGFLGLFIWYRLISTEFYKTKKKILILILLTPIVFTGDMYSLYDTSYLLLIPLIAITTETLYMKHQLKKRD